MGQCASTEQDLSSNFDGLAGGSSLHLEQETRSHGGRLVMGEALELGSPEDVIVPLEDALYRRVREYYNVTLDELSQESFFPPLSRAARGAGKSQSVFVRSSDHMFVIKSLDSRDVNTIHNHAVMKSYAEHVTAGELSLLPRIFLLFKVQSKQDMQRRDKWQRSHTANAAEEASAGSQAPGAAPGPREETGGEAEKGEDAGPAPPSRSPSQNSRPKFRESACENPHLTGRSSVMSAQTRLSTARGVGPLLPRTSKDRYYIIMNNWLPQDGDYWNEIYDLKGSHAGRFAGRGAHVMKDLDLHDDIHLTQEYRAPLLAALRRDSEWLAQNKIIDYSMVLGVKRESVHLGSFKHHYERWASQECLNPKTNVMGPLMSMDENASVINKYYLGIIDFLRQHTWKETLENVFKEKIMRDKDPSVQEPLLYGERFASFLDRRCKHDGISLHRGDQGVSRKGQSLRVGQVVRFFDEFHNRKGVEGVLYPSYEPGLWRIMHANGWVVTKTANIEEVVGDELKRLKPTKSMRTGRGTGRSEIDDILNELRNATNSACDSQTNSSDDPQYEDNDSSRPDETGVRTWASKSE